MFNLLVSGVGWEPNSDTMSTGRTFEYTDEALIARFMSDKIVDTQGVIGLPCLFMTEDGADPPPSRIGRLTRVRKSGNQYLLDYFWDPAFPPIPNSVLHKVATDLGIREFEFTRVHWAIKDADLFETLYRLGLGARSSPKVFQLKDIAVKDNLVAVMMPFAKDFDHVYAGIQAAATQADMECQRVDDIWENDHIIQDVIDLIVKAKIVVCDLTGRNSNVFYEMGIAHSLGKDVVMLAQNSADVPFDVTHIRYIKYLGNEQGIESMTTALARRLERLSSP